MVYNRVWEPKTNKTQSAIDRVRSVIQQQLDFGAIERSLSFLTRWPWLKTEEPLWRPPSEEEKAEGQFAYQPTYAKEKAYEALPTWQRLGPELAIAAALPPYGVGGVGKAGKLAKLAKGAKPPIKPPVAPVVEAMAEDADSILAKFGKAITDPSSLEAREMTNMFRAEERAARSRAFMDVMDASVAKGDDIEDAIVKASRELSGKYPDVVTKITFPKSVVGAAYQKIRSVIKAETSISEKIKGFEIKATIKAFDNAIARHSIPDTPGTRGMSALSRLQRVFGEKSPILDALQGKTGLTEPVGIEDPQLIAYLSKLTDKTGKQLNLIEVATSRKVENAFKKIGVNIIDALGIPKATKFAFDVSMMARQLGMSGARHPVSWAKTWSPYFRAMKSEKVAFELDNLIRTEPDRMNAVHKLGLDLFDIKANATYWNRPETMASRLAEKYIPGVRMSNRGAAVAVNYFMTDVGKSLIKVLDKMGAGPEEYKTMGSLLNELVGRGEMPNVLKGTAGDILNKLLSSPRYTASRFEWPTKLVSSSKAVRQEAWSTLFAWAGVNAAILGMGYALGARVEGDPRSSDVIKLRIGNKRIDLWQGSAQILRLGAQLAPYIDERGNIDWTMGSRKRADGKVIPVPRSEIINRFAQSKESPGVGAIVSILTGKDFVGRKMDFKSLSAWLSWLKNSFAPASFEEIGDAYIIDGLGSAAISTIGLTGAGVSTYESIAPVGRSIPSREMPSRAFPTR